MTYLTLPHQHREKFSISKHKKTLTDDTKEIIFVPNWFISPLKKLFERKKSWKSISFLEILLEEKRKSSKKFWNVKNKRQPLEISGFPKCDWFFSLSRKLVQLLQNWRFFSVFKDTSKNWSKSSIWSFQQTLFLPFHEFSIKIIFYLVLKNLQRQKNWEFCSIWGNSIILVSSTWKNSFRTCFSFRFLNKNIWIELSYYFIIIYAQTISLLAW